MLRITRLIFVLLTLFCVVIIPIGLAQPDTTIAVVDFNNLSGKRLPNIGQVANEVFSTLLTQTNRFNVVERTKLLSILTEQGLSMSGLTDSSKSTVQIGKLLGADYLVTGSILSFEADVKKFQGYGVTTLTTIYEMNVNTKILNVNTGQIEFALTIPVQETSYDTSSFSSESTGVSRKLLMKALSQATDKLVEQIESKQPKNTDKIIIGFNSSPKGADVEVDGVFMGNTPLNIPLNPGVHEVKISLAGYEPWIKKINAYEGLIVNTTLEKKK